MRHTSGSSNERAFAHWRGQLPTRALAPAAWRVQNACGLRLTTGHGSVHGVNSAPAYTAATTYLLRYASVCLVTAKKNMTDGMIADNDGRPAAVGYATVNS